MGKIAREYSALLVAGIIMFITGVVLRWIIKERKHKRTAATGLERFSTHLEGTMIRLLEKLLLCLSWIFIIGGLLFILAVAQMF